MIFRSLRRRLPWLAIVMCATRAPAQQAVSRDTVIPAAALQEDLRIARAALVESQVGRTWFQTARRFDAGFDALARQIQAPMSAARFHARLAPLVAALGHGHVTLERPLPSIGFRTRFLDSTARYFPLALRIVNRRVFILADLGDTAQLARGTELLRVDGVPIAALLDTMQRYLSADGRNTSFKRYQLGTYWRFHELLAQLHGARDSSVILVRAPAAPDRRATAVTRVAHHATSRQLLTRYEARTGQRIDTFPPAVELAFPEHGTAWLRVSSFYEGLLPKDAGTFPDAFQRAFRTITDSAATDLVLDVRGNEGGNTEYSPVLYSHIATREFRMPGRTVLADTTVSWLRYAPDAADDVKAFAAAPKDFVSRTRDGLWVLEPQFDSVHVRTYAPARTPFRGRVFILTDGGSFSATNAFLALVAAERSTGGRQVTFVGEENGGDIAAGRVSGGTQQAIVLPNTRERLTLALTGTVPRIGEAPPRVTIPDVRVQPSARDIARGTDAALVATRRLIARTRERAPPPD